MKYFFYILFFLMYWPLTFLGQQQTLHQLNSLLINTVMEDLFTPPVASRVYVYPQIAFYECIRYDEENNYISLAGKLNELKKLPRPPIHNNNFLSACYAFSYTAQNFVGSEYIFSDWRTAFSDSIKNIYSPQIILQSQQYGKQMSDSIIAWSKKDGYLKSKSMFRHILINKKGHWQPTPNEYLPGLEPFWKTVRPMCLTNASQFSPYQKLIFNESKQSTFYKNVEQVYKISKHLDSSKKAIAWYWDDNPNVSVQEGHLTYYIHKVSPGGHWMLIAQQACIEKNVSVIKASQAYTLTAIAVFDAFISCWHEKYKTDLIRPVTIINQYFDKEWQPLIQTPPFPEFTSGHAVLSNAAAIVLTELFGNHYSFTDNTEIIFGIMPRKFESFLFAAQESSWSRVYGGIHYPETARISIIQGKQIGANVVNQILKKK